MDAFAYPAAQGAFARVPGWQVPHQPGVDPTPPTGATSPARRLQTRGTEAVGNVLQEAAAVKTAGGASLTERAAVSRLQFPGARLVRVTPGKA
ncbi:hypothetical protein AGIG_G14792 [Arapaima gigas]